MDKIPHGFRPCLSCTRSCYQEHWPSPSRDTFRSPCFMRALCDSNLAAMATCWMVIPSAWLKLYGDEVGNSAILHGPSGNTWQVGVGRPKWVAFRVGWRTFAADNGLEKGDILVFTLMGKSEFAVRIFDSKTGLEKESALTATNTGCYDSKSPGSFGVKRKQRDDDENAAELKRICAHNNGVQLVHNDQSIDSTHTEKVLQQRRAKVSTFSSAAALISYRECALLDLNSQPLFLHQNPTSGNGNFFPEIDHQLLDAVVARTFQGYASGIVYQPHPISIRSQDVGEECHIQGQSKAQVCGSGGLGPATRFASQRRPVMDARERSTEFPHRQNNSPAVIPSHHRSQILDLNKEQFADDVGPHMLSPDVILEREKALELARRAQESIDRPSHLVVLRAFHVHGRAFVRFPVTFGKQHMPRKTVSMHLLDSHGHRWPMTWLRDNETHMGLTRGWRDFCLAEGLLEGDVCIFELIELNKLTLLIHVFRSSETRDSNQVIITKPKRPELLQMQNPSHKKCFDRKRKVVDKEDGRRQRKEDSLADKDALPTSSEGQYPCTPTKLTLYKAFHRTTLTDSVGPSRASNRRQDSIAAGSVGRERLKKLSLWASKVQGGMYSSSKKISCESESVAGTSLERCCKDDEELTDSVMSKTQDATFSEILCQMSSGCVGANNSRNCRNPSTTWVPTSTLSTGLIEKDDKSSAAESHGFECQHLHERDCTKKCHYINAARRREIRGGSGKLVSNTLKNWAKTRKRYQIYGKTEETRTWGWKWYTPDYSVLRRKMQVLNRNSRFYIASRRTPVTDSQKEATKEAALALKTENPATLVVLKSSNVYKTYIVEIPPEFSRQLSPDERVNIFLRDAAGNKTRVLLTQEALTKGWRQFSLEHLLEEGDVCVFEIIDTSQRTILVHIFRVVDVDYINGNYRNHYRIISAGFQRTHRSQVKNGLKTQANGQVVNEVATNSPFQARRHSVNRSLYLAILKTRANLRKPRPVEEDNPYYSKEHMDLNLDLDPSTVPPPASNTLWGSPSCTMSTSCASRSPVLKLYPELDSELVGAKNNSSQQLCPMSDSLLRLPVTSPSSGTALADICEISSCKNRQQTMLYPENDTMVVMPLPLPPDEDESEPEEGNYYRVVRILKKRYFDNEKQYLAELDGPVVQSDGCRGIREYDDMNWWIPEKSFSPGFTSCYLR